MITYKHGYSEMPRLPRDRVDEIAYALRNLQMLTIVNFLAILGITLWLSRDRTRRDET